MSTPVPLTIANDLFDRLESHFLSGTEPSEFERRLIERDATKLEKDNPHISALMRGALAAFRWDTAMVRKELDLACAFDGSIATLYNAALTCRFVNDFDKACALVGRAYELASGDDLLRYRLVALLACTGRVHEALAIAESRSFQTAEQRELPAFLPTLVRAMDVIGLTSERVACEVRTALAVMTEQRIRQRDIVYEVHEDPEGGVGVVAAATFFGDLSEELELECALGARLMSFSTWDPQEFAIEFRGEASDAVLAA